MAATLTHQTAEQKIREFLEQLGIEPEQITRDATFEELDVDSLDIVELVQVMEEEYDVRLNHDDVATIKTVGDAIDLVVGKRQ